MNVVLVQLSVAVTDGKGNYVNGLRPEDFEVTEDKIPQKVSSFEEGSGTGAGPDSEDADQPLAAKSISSKDGQPGDIQLKGASTLPP